MEHPIEQRKQEAVTLFAMAIYRAYELRDFGFAVEWPLPIVVDLELTQMLRAMHAHEGSLEIHETYRQRARELLQDIQGALERRAANPVWRQDQTKEFKAVQNKGENK